MKKSEKFILGTVVGGAIGSVLGLLFAPKAGKETRKDIKDASQKAFDWSKKQAEKIGDHKDEFDEAVDRLHAGTARIKRSFKALRKRTVDPTLEKLEKSRDQERKGN